MSHSPNPSAALLPCHSYKGKNNTSLIGVLQAGHPYVAPLVWLLILKTEAPFPTWNVSVLSLNSVQLNIQGLLVRPHTAIWQAPVPCGQTIKPQNIFIVLLNPKASRWMCFLPGCHKWTFMVWWITLAPFSPVTLTLHYPGYISCFFASYCVRAEICAPNPIRNFSWYCRGATGIRFILL